MKRDQRAHRANGARAVAAVHTASHKRETRLHMASRDSLPGAEGSGGDSRSTGGRIPRLRSAPRAREAGPRPSPTTAAPPSRPPRPEAAQSAVRSGPRPVVSRLSPARSLPVDAVPSPHLPSSPSSPPPLLNPSPASPHVDVTVSHLVARVQLERALLHLQVARLGTHRARREEAPWHKRAAPTAAAGGGVACGCLAT